MTKKGTQERIKVMQAYVDGKTIQIYDYNSHSWKDVDNPSWDFQYRIKPEPKLRPYKNAEEFLKAQKEHGMYIKENDIYVLPVRIAFNRVCLHEGNGYVSFEYLLQYYQWQDGTPVGILEK